MSNSSSSAAPPVFPGDQAITDEVVRSHHLTDDEYRATD